MVSSLIAFLLLLFRLLHFFFHSLNELSGSTGNGKLARLLDLGLEDDLVALPPHLGDDGLARDDGASEANLDVLKCAEPKRMFC